jgi:hypothetical protein
MFIHFLNPHFTAAPGTQRCHFPHYFWQINFFKTNLKPLNKRKKQSSAHLISKKAERRKKGIVNGSIKS